ncbi:MAG: hypothetical protein WDO13_15965 [Verrucomicrobiota bacterium]
MGLGAWVAIYTGVTLLRSNFSSHRRDYEQIGPRTKRTLVGYLLLLLGVAALVATFLWHHGRAF